MKITDEAGLRALYGEKLGRSVRKEQTTLDPHCRAFIAASPFMMMSTSGPQGIDVTPRGDHPGFVVVEDDTTLLIPDRPGNNRLDSLTNLLENPQIGLIFMIPTVRETLRIRGTAEIIADDALNMRMAIKGRPALAVIRVSISVAYIHCAKAMMRSRLWEPDEWPDARPVATMSEMMRDHAQDHDKPLEPEEEMLARYRKALY
jgi:PPOX class probable FMN-dependent enzyme